MTEHLDIETADRLSRRRARLLPVLAILFLSGQAIHFGGPEEPERIVDQIKVVAWLAWALLLLYLLASGGGFLRGKAVRALINDEITRANRDRAYAMGFWLAVGAAIGLYVLTLFEPVGGREAVHIIMTAAIAGALLIFAKLERRAHGNA